MIIIFVEFIDQLIDYPINCASLTTNARGFIETSILICWTVNEVRYNCYVTKSDKPHICFLYNALDDYMWPVRD